ncbi:MAG: hypothetical protein EB163_04675 [Nitrososphaeria archaeon]|nr:hypothetical protein [Nitrososphaeria archaeon]NDB50992.1 hypothetical protein [Nitrosopumilaceae archaeon]NDB90787.1 hypothetical protein [Nitrososphaerota archaeon]NDB63077.1 hypothetical protein [Nitrosopumilaceae archaeon]NDB91881.1 hypothetical protein [Nitrososphaeria archaeon]
MTNINHQMTFVLVFASSVYCQIQNIKMIKALLAICPAKHCQLNKWQDHMRCKAGFLNKCLTARFV